MGVTACTQSDVSKPFLSAFFGSETSESATHLLQEGDPFRGRICPGALRVSKQHLCARHERLHEREYAPTEAISRESLLDNVERAGVLPGRRSLQSHLGQVERLACECLSSVSVGFFERVQAANRSRMTRNRLPTSSASKTHRRGPLQLRLHHPK